MPSMTGFYLLAYGFD